MGWALIPTLLVAACTEQLSPDGNGVGVAEVALSVATVPTGVLCIKVVVTVGGQPLTPPAITVTPGSSSASFGLGQLASGAATLTGSAFNVACGSVTAATVPGWISDPATASLAPGVVTAVPMTFRQNNPVTIGIGFAPNVADISVGAGATYARMADGTVYQWGLVGSGNAIPVPTPAPSLTNVTQVVGGYVSACARKTDGSVSCWGTDEGGQLGAGIPAGTTSNTPVRVGTLTGATALSMGAATTCGMFGTIMRCWGDNSLGEFGNGTATSSTTPVSTGSFFASAVAFGAGHNCTIDNLGGLECTGLNSSGQLGAGSTADNSLSYLGTGLKNVVSVAGGNAHTCAVMGNGTVRCFGKNTNGQLGDGTTANRTTPVTVLGLNNVVQVQGGMAHTCARLQDGTVSCWGSAAMLGAGVVADQTTPVSVAGLTGVIDIQTSHSASHTCALLTDHSLRCWGENVFGQIGNGNTVFVNRPTAVVF